MSDLAANWCYLYRLLHHSAPVPGADLAGAELYPRHMDPHPPHSRIQLHRRRSEIPRSDTSEMAAKDATGRVRIQRGANPTDYPVRLPVPLKPRARGSGGGVGGAVCARTRTD